MAAGSAETDASEADGEAKAAFHLALRAHGVRDLAVLRAMELVPRSAFLDERHAGLAARDLPVPIPAGQTASPAWLVARMIEALAVAPGQRMLQVGAGSGYATAILRQLCDDVVACERVRGLAEAAERHLASLGLSATVHWVNGFSAGAVEGSFDRILIHARCDERPDALLDRLVPGGVLVCARPCGAGQGIVRIAAVPEGWEETPVCACSLAPSRSGLNGLR